MGIGKEIIFDDDKDSYITATGDDTVLVVIGGNNAMEFHDSEIELFLPFEYAEADTAESYIFVDIPVSATADDGDEVRYHFCIDGDTVMTLKGTADGSGGIDEIQLILASAQNDASDPTLAFGDGDTGFYEAADDELRLVHGGAAAWKIHSAYFSGTETGQIKIQRSPAGTIPHYSFDGDEDTGMRRVAGDTVALYAGGVKAVQYGETGGFVTEIRDSLYYHKESSSIADDGEIVLATGVAGWGEAMAGDNEEWAQFRFTSAGVVTLIANSANVVNTDTDAKFCIYDAGSGIAIKNRLGATKTVAVNVEYFTP